MSHYRFVTRWRFQAPLEQVWDLLAHPEDWPGWWRGVEAVEALEPGGENDLGALRRFTWKSALPYRLAFEMRTTAIDKPHRMEGRASGHLEGTGVWTLAQEGAWTAVRYDWQVRATPRWMRLLAPLLRPAFAWNHDVVMRWGGEGLARRLGCSWERAEG